MDRFFAQNRLSALIDGALSAAEERAVKKTIAKNADLSADHAAMLQAIELMHSVGPAQPPAGFQVRLMTQVEALPKPGGQIARVRSAARRVPMEAVALTALALVIGIVVSQRGAEVPVAHEGPPDMTQAALPTPPPAAPSQAVAGEPEADQVIPEKPSAKPPPSKPAAAAFEGSIPRQTPPEGIEHLQPSAYNILGLGDQVLFAVSRLNQAHGGRMVNANGVAIAPATLTEAQAFKRVFLVVPSTQAAGLHGKLRAMTGKMAVPVTTKFSWLRPGQTIIMIEAQL
jgi:hypothetical protein